MVKCNLIFLPENIRPLLLCVSSTNNNEMPTFVSRKKENLLLNSIVYMLICFASCLRPCHHRMQLVCSEYIESLFVFRVQMLREKLLVRR